MTATLPKLVASDHVHPIQQQARQSLRVNGRRVHELKVMPNAFTDIADHHMRGNLRRDDRDYGESDLVVLFEWEPIPGVYTGRVLAREITHVAASLPGLMLGYVLLSFGAVAATLAEQLDTALVDLHRAHR